MHTGTRHLRVSVVGLLSIVALLAGMVSHAPRAGAEHEVRPQQSPSSIHLPMIMTNGRPASSLELIEKALEEKRISADQAITYQVYAVYDDQRLPEQYRGDNSGIHGSSVMADAAAQYEKLAPETQQLLNPFFTPPAYVGSALARPVSSLAGTDAEAGFLCLQRLNGIYDSRVTTNGKVRVWWPKSDATAAAMAADVVSDIDTSIWAKVTGLMRREPLTDGLRPCNGGDDRLDIYVNPLGPVAAGNFKVGIRGVTTNYLVGCEARPAWIQINSQIPPDERVITVAHELMHAIQWSYDVSEFCLKPEYNWLMEATAAWVQDYVEAGNDLEHQFAREYLDKPHVSLEDESDPMHHYYSYLFFFFLSHGYSPDWIRQIWEQTATQKSLGAINAAIGGGLAERWPEFARRNWNQPPVDHYKRWDKIPVGAALVLKDALPLGEAELGDTDVPHLAARYFHLTMPDINIRSVTFYNGWSYKLSKQTMRTDADSPTGTYIAWEAADVAKNKGLKVQVIARVNGTWTDAQDITDLPYITLCRDVAAERLEELVVIVSNSEWQDRSWVVKPQGLEPRFWTSNAGCYRFNGRSERTYTSSGVTESTIANVTWTRSAPGNVLESGGKSALISHIFLPTGTVSWQMTGSDGGCTYSGNGGGPLAFGEGMLQIFDYAVAGDASRAYQADGISELEGEWNSSCPMEPPGPYQQAIGSWLAFEQSASPWNKLQQNGLTITDSATIEQGNPSDTYSWNFISQPEP